MSTPEWISLLNTKIPVYGLDIPAVTLCMAAITVAVGLGFGIRDRIKVSRLVQQFDTLIAALKQQKKPVTQDVMERVHSFFVDDKICNELKECWEEFRETLLSERLENGEVIYTNTLQAEQFFTAHFLFRSLPAITTSLPGIATGLGLLGTFMALLCGLAELHMADSGSVSGIGPFINALSGKFFSSIAGLATAIGLTIYISINRKSKMEKCLHALQHQINVLFPRKSSEFILLELKKELTRIDKAVGHLATDMAAKLPEVIQSTLGGDMQSLLKSINSLGQATEALKEVNSSQLRETLTAVLSIKEGVEKLHSQNNDAITESIKGLMDEFKQGLHDSASNEIEQLTKSLSNAAQFLQDMQTRGELDAERQKIADERMNQLVESLQVASQNQQAQVSASTQQMNDLLQQIVEQAGHLNQQGQQSIQEQMQQLMIQSEQQGQAWRQQLQDITGEVLGQFKAGSQQQMEQLTTQSGEMVQRLDHLLTRLGEVGQQHQEQSQQALVSLRTQLEEASRSYSDQVQQQQNELNTAIENALSRLAEFMQTREDSLQNAYQHLENTEKALADTLSTGSQDLRQTILALKDTIVLSKHSLEQLNNGQAAISKMVHSLDHAQESLVGGMKDAQLTASTYRQAIDAMQALHNRQSEVYSKLETNLKLVLADIDVNLQSYTTRINEGLSHNLKEWDKQLKEASNVFAGVVGEVKASADDLADIMDELGRKITNNHNSRSTGSSKIEELTNV
jgi:hypothetical protein